LGIELGLLKGTLTLKGKNTEYSSNIRERRRRRKRRKVTELNLDIK